MRHLRATGSTRGREAATPNYRADFIENAEIIHSGTINTPAIFRSVSRSCRPGDRQVIVGKKLEHVPHGTSPLLRKSRLVASLMRTDHG
jgi:hypothetical protein